MKKVLLLSLMLALLLPLLGYTQGARTVSGQVTDQESGQPLPGVAVIVQGTTVGTTTGASGEFTLNVPENANTLVFRFLGYAEVVREIGNATTINVAMGLDSEQLQEVVVTALGREEEERTLGYATQQVGSEQITQGRERSVANALQGKVAGVNIQSQGGGPGASTRVVIRGAKSISQSNQALFVIDGIPVDNSASGTTDALNAGVDVGNRANDINPDDIESINILKGPAAAALYGARAANGVIMITTKSGRGATKKAEITYLTSYTVEDILRYPELQNRYGQGFFGAPDLLENTSWGPRFTGELLPWGQIIDGQQRVKPYSALEDNIKEFFDYGYNWTNTVSLSGAADNATYYASYSTTQQEGVVPTTEYSRHSLAVKGSTKLLNKFNSTVSLTYTKSGGDFALTGQGNSVFNQIIQTPRDIPVRELEDLESPFNDEAGFYSPYTINPYWSLRNQTYENEVDRLFGNITLGYDIMEGLNVTYRIGTDFYTDRRKQFMAIRNVQGQNAANNDNGMYAERQVYYREVNSDLIVSYNRDLSDILTLDLLVGNNINQRENDDLTATADALANNEFRSLSNIIGTPLTVSFRDKRRLVGIYGSAKLGYRNFLWLEVTGRNDWSSTLPIDDNSFFYPSVNLAFDAAEAFGLAETTPINFAKIRANYANVGNDALPYSTRSVFVSGNISDGFAGTDLNFPFAGLPGFEVSNVIGNANLEPENTSSWEVGADMRFFNERLRVDAAYYNSKSTDQIINVPLSFATGFGSAFLNAATIRNEGVELLVGGIPIEIGDFSWDISVNFTKNENTVEDVAGDNEISLGGLSSAALVISEGRPYGTFLAEDFLRDPQGRIVVNPSTGRPRLATEQTYQGSIQPDWQGGLVNTFRYKGLRMSVVFDTRQGGKIYSRTRGTQRFAGTAPETLFNDRQPYIIPNSVVQVGNSDEYIENTTPLTNSNLYEYWGNLPEGTNIIDASFTKLREVSISYSLPRAITEKTFFGNIEVGLSGRNLVLWTPDENTYIDPEVNSFGNGNLQGYEFSSYPSTRSWGANLRVTF
ncbi:SusC/RagA family TonB-linked outer membrane protein [Pontibacter chinhatensis]|uniref:TonB-linked outer membrane protein, SusC/RagA family n=1 Tax=Pontibacter chinhatensis TaxID=1436961 RepID=A0A1I2RTX1_9BACT|nr:SusC/RagA family TonB-linked outer membrane protein [Pontibacter chinhatensis]SFG43982.1 TonB-linked outer membrane protein, SusC/RagA family [Pontibacter chinhatensis]